MSVPRSVSTEQRTGASSREERAWNTIRWQQVHENVRRLQARIVKAQQAGRWGKVKALQRLLTHSFSGKALAVLRVTENQGKRTPGVDGETWNAPEQKTSAIWMLRQHGYRPKPLRRISIPKSNGKLRPLGIPTMFDRAMQALYLLALDPIAETTGDPCSYGFRSHRSTADAIEHCFVALGRTHSPTWVLEGDIKSCFDRISHAWILAHIPMDKSILRKWLKAGYLEQNTWHPTDEGTPQGGICSPVIANMVLDGLLARLRAAFPRQFNRGGRLWSPKVNLIRYADDFVITGDTPELLEQEVKPLVEAFLRERGLELSQEKTLITHIDQGFDFLGQNIRKYGGKLLIKPSAKSIQAFLTKIRTTIKDIKMATAGDLILALNPIIKGWAMYHRHVVSSKVFQRVDHAIHQALWRWAKRRHSQKGQAVGKEPLLPGSGTATMGFLRRNAKPAGRDAHGAPHEGIGHPYPPPPTHQLGGQPVRPPVGNLLRGTLRPENGSHHAGPSHLVLPLETATRDLPGLPPTDHLDHGME